MLASGSWDKAVKLWNTNTGDCVSTLSVDSGDYGVQSISYSPAADMIAAGCYNGKIHILDTLTVAVKRSLTGHRYTLFLCFGTNNFPNRCTFLE
jgi:WD40 repeat protein